MGNKIFFDFHTLIHKRLIYRIRTETIARLHIFIRTALFKRDVSAGYAIAELFTCNRVYKQFKRAENPKNIAQ